MASSYGLPESRIREIVEASSFECHKTTGVCGEQKEPQMCAGLSAMLDDTGNHNQIMQVAGRLLGITFDDIDRSDTFDSIEDCIKEHSPAIDCKPMSHK